MPFVLSRGQTKRWIRVDPQDVALAERGWHCNQGYVLRVIGSKTRYLHREILGLTHGDGIEVDHINRNPLDNRRCNLRLVTRAQQNQNVTPRVGGTSRFRGVSWNRATQRWVGQVNVDGRRVFHKAFDSELAAHEAVSVVRAKHMPYSSEALKVVA